MNKRIEEHLAAVESPTVKALADAVGSDRTDVWRTQFEMTGEDASEHGAGTAADVRISALLARIEHLTAERDAARRTAGDWRNAAAYLEKRVDQLTIQPTSSRLPIFMTLGHNTPPVLHDSLEKAQRRGELLVRTEKELEVLVLEPVGRIVRGSEWRPR
ncbi:1-pyrroline-5-carboxylate dehydrogenase [Burkholderia gladioli]|uniref:1-pyrroline-5-carboxylate dehydrogenase n=1 Tax=Burkholderia gladioli TaxID=28095 RepID=UPI00163F1579|nr:1-pyrroline-5-carboxylate dehydrogenase [Burkholderia gladioli]